MLCFNHHGKANNERVECAIRDKKKYKPCYITRNFTISNCLVGVSCDQGSD